MRTNGGCHAPEMNLNRLPHLKSSYKSVAYLISRWYKNVDAGHIRAREQDRALALNVIIVTMVILQVPVKAGGVQPGRPTNNP